MTQPHGTNVDNLISDMLREAMKHLSSADDVRNLQLTCKKLSERVSDLSQGMVKKDLSTILSEANTTVASIESDWAPVHQRATQIRTAIQQHESVSNVAGTAKNTTKLANLLNSFASKLATATKQINACGRDIQLKRGDVKDAEARQDWNDATKALAAIMKRLKTTNDQITDLQQQLANAQRRLAQMKSNAPRRSMDPEDARL